jgi:hypothetical protein
VKSFSDPIDRFVQFDGSVQTGSATLSFTAPPNPLDGSRSEVIAIFVLGKVVGGVGFLLEDLFQITQLPPCLMYAVRFRPIDSPLDANPNAGGGLRIFAEKAKPNGPVLNEVSVTAAVGVAGVPVAFKSFDMDDPSTDQAPVDPNGAEGNDNRGIPVAGTLSSESAMSDAFGFATVTFKTTLQPGDNFKVAASCDAAYLDRVDLDPNDGSKIKDASGQELPTANAKLTDMLTVWRRVHIEADSMSAVAGNSYTGIVNGVFTIPITGQSFVITNLANMEAGREQNGRLVIEGTAFPITTNTGGAFFVNGLVPPAVAGKRFTAFDDDDFNDNSGAAKNGDIGENLVLPDTSRLQDSDSADQNVFAPGYVRPTFDLKTYGLANPNPHPAFVLNQAGDAAEDVRALFSFDNAAQNTTDFWVVYLLGAYQAITSEDQDPDTESAAVGRVDMIRGQGAVTYLELVSRHELAAIDSYIDKIPLGLCKNAAGGDNRPSFKQKFRNADSTAHEMGHLFGGLHTDHGLMTDQCNDATRTFSPKTLDSIRSTEKP